MVGNFDFVKDLKNLFAIANLDFCILKYTDGHQCSVLSLSINTVGTFYLITFIYTLCIEFTVKLIYA